MQKFVQLVGLCALLRSVNSWQLPGLVPKNYEKGQMIDIYVGQLWTERSSFTFDYYMLNWCSNNKGLAYDPESYGTTLTGSPLHESPFNHKFGYDRNIQICQKTFSHGECEQFSMFMQ